MSSFVYGAVSRKREQADERRSTQDQPPGLRSYVDAVAALVPAEVLVLHTAIMSGAARTAHHQVTTGHGHHHKTHEVVQTTFTETGTHWDYIFAGLCLFSAFLYAAGHLQGPDWKKHANWVDLLRVLIPPAAFVVWTIGQKGSMFYAIHSGLSTADRLAIVGIGGGVLAVLAGGSAVKENGKPKRAAAHRTQPQA
jgi:hypothetical protein